MRMQLKTLKTGIISQSRAEGIAELLKESIARLNIPVSPKSNSRLFLVLATELANQ